MLIQKYDEPGDNQNPKSEIRNPQLKARVPLFADEPQTLGELFTKAVEKRPREDALNYKKNDQWHSISSAEMLARIENIALGLRSLGLEKGDRAALLSGNSPEWTLTDAGCQFAGIINVPLTRRLLRIRLIHYQDSARKYYFCKTKIV